jgi:fibronectin type 3 domain-containing protein
MRASSAQLRSLLLVAITATATGSCARKPPAKPIAVAKVCGAQTTTPGLLYKQDFEAPCYDWFTRGGVPVTIATDTSGEKEVDGLKYGVMAATETKEGGPYYSSWLNQIEVVPGQFYCLDLSVAANGAGDGLFFGIHRFGAKQNDLGKENMLAGPYGFVDPEMGEVAGIDGASGFWEYIQKSFQAPADTHFIQLYGNLDWTAKNGSVDVTSWGGVDGVRVRLGACNSALPRPPAPTNLVAVAGNQQVNLTWTGVPTATHYQVKRSTTMGGPYTDVMGGMITARSFNDATGLINGTTYYYVVTALNAAGESDKSNEASAKPQPLPPFAPSNLTVVTGRSQATLTWDDNSTDETKFKIERKLASDTTFVEVNWVATDVKTYLDPSLPTGTYVWRVRAFNAIGHSDYSNTVSAMVTATLPPPDNLVATAGNAQVSLTWTAVPGATSYTVKRHTASGGPYTTVSPGPGSMTSLTVGSLTNNTRYFFVVSASDAMGGGLNSNEASAVPGASTGGWTSQDIGAVAAAGSWSFNSTTGVHTVLGNGADIWNAVDEFRFTHQQMTGDGSIIARVTAFTGTGTINANAKAGVMIRQNLNADSPHVTSCLPVQGQTTLIKQVRRLTANTASTSATGASPTFPRWVKVTRTGTSLSTFESTDGTSWTQVGTAQSISTLGATTYVGLAVSSHVDGTNYTATFDNVTITGSVAMPPPPLPPSPTGLTCVAGTGQCTLSWTAVPGATGYTVKRAITIGGPYTNLTPTVTPSPTPSFVDGSRTPGTNYYYVVSVTTAAGTSPNSAEVLCTPAAAAGPGPTSLTCTPGNGQCVLSWAAVASATTYNVKRSTTNGGPYDPVEVGVAGTTYTDRKDIANGTTYFYRVSATLSGKETQDSPQAQCDPNGPPKPAAPSNLVAVGGAGTVSLTWNDNSSNETQFKLERRLEGPTGTGFEELPVFIGPNTSSTASYVDKPVAAGMYTYRIRANNGGLTGTDSDYSNTAPATVTMSPPPPDTPFGVAVVTGPELATVSWSDVSTETEYRVERKVDGAPDSTFAVIATVGANITSNTQPTPAGTYNWRVIASNGAGDSGFASPVTKTVPATGGWVGHNMPAGLTPPGSFTPPSGPSISVSGGGSAVGGGMTDSLYFVHKQLSGDGSFTVRVASLCGGTPGSCPSPTATEAGIMMRDGTGFNDRSIAVVLTPTATNKFQMVARKLAGGSTIPPELSTGNSGVPAYLRLTRSGNSFAAFASMDGVTFTQVGATQPIPMGQVIEAGLVVASHHATLTATAVFDSILLAPTTVPAAPQGLTLALGDQSFVLTWQQVPGAVDYVVRRALDPTRPFEVFAVQTSASLSQTNQGDLDTFYFTVSARSPGGEGPQSVVIKAGPIAPLVTWSFAGRTVDSSKVDPPSVVAATLASGGLRKSPSSSLTPRMTLESFELDGWPSGAVDLTKYVELSSLADKGSAIRYERLDFTIGNGGASSGSWQLRSSVDDYAAVLAQNTWNSSLPVKTQADLASLGTRAGMVTFRIYLFNTQSRQGLKFFSTRHPGVGIWGRVETSNIQPPLAPVVSCTSGNGSCTLSWNTVSGAVGYLIKRSGNGSPPTALGVVTGTSYGDTTVVNGPTYTYFVSTITATAQSLPAQVTCNPSPPSLPAPTGVACTLWSNGLCSVSWNAVPGAFTYNVKRADTPGGPVYTTLTSMDGYYLGNTTFVDTSAAPGVPHFYKVSAVSGTTESPNSTSEGSCTPDGPPAAPSNLVAADGVGEATLTWNDNSNNETGFNIWRKKSTEAMFSPLDSVMPNVTTYTDTTSAGTYTYTVRATGVGFTYSMFSNTDDAVVVDLLPAPTGLVATAGDKKVTLTWNAVPGANFYTVKRNTNKPDPGGPPYDDVLPNPNVTTPGYTDLNLTNGIKYRYVVTANNGKPSPISMEASATPVPPVPPARPTNLSGQVINLNNANSVTLTWTDASSDETGFRVERKLGSGSFASIGTPGANSTSFNDPGPLTAGSTYTYRVFATKTNAPDSLQSNEVQATPSTLTWTKADVGAVAAPGTFTQSGGVFTLTASGAGIDGTTDEFLMVYIPLTGDVSLTARIQNICNGTPGTCPTSSNPRAGVMLRDGTSATAKTMAMFEQPKATNKFRSFWRTATTGSQESTTTAPTTPWVRITRVGNLLSTYFSTSTGATMPADNSFTKLGTDQTQSLTTPRAALVMTSTLDGTPATVKFDGVTVITPATVIALPALPAAPTGVACAPGNAQCTISWNAVSGATSYTVKRGNNANGPFDTIVSPANHTATSFTDTTAMNGSTYHYVVSASNATGEGPNSALPAASCTPVPPPPPPTGVTCTAFDSKCTLSWTAAPTATSYKVSRGTAMGGPFTPLSAGQNVVGTSFSDTTAVNGTTYFFVVMASNAGGDSQPSAPSNSCQPFAAPPAPSNLTATLVGTTVTLNWTDNSNNENLFRIEQKESMGTFAEVATVPMNTITFSKTLPGGTYTFQVRGSNGPGNLNHGQYSNISNPVTVSLPPVQPMPPVVTAGDRQVMVSWTNVPGATAYLVQRSLMSGGPYLPIPGGATTGTSVTDTNLTNGVTYRYILTAGNTAGNSTPSIEVPATPGSTWTDDNIPSTLSPPGAFTENAGSITVTGAGASFDGASADEFNFVNQTLTGDGSITARITDLCGGNGSACANQFARFGLMMREGTGAGDKYMGIFISPAASIMRHSMQWRLTSNGNAANSPNGTPSQVPEWLRLVRTGNNFFGYFSFDSSPTTPPDSSFTVLNPGGSSIVMSATVRVGLVVHSKSAGSLASATFSNVTIGRSAPALWFPNGLTAVAGKGAVSLSWNAVADASSYVIRRGTSAAGPFNTTVATGVTNLSYLDTTVTNGTTFHYVVAAKNDATTGPDSTFASATPSTSAVNEQLALWTFPGTVDSGTARAVTLTATNVAGGSLSKATPLTSASLPAQFTAGAWPGISTTIDTSKHFEFSATGNNGFGLGYQWVRFSLVGEEGLASWELRSNADNYASTLAKGVYGSGLAATGGIPIQANVSSLGIRTGTTIFRVYTYGNTGAPLFASGAAGNFRRGLLGSSASGTDLQVYGRAFPPGTASISPTSQNFGSVPTGSAGPLFPFTLTNNSFSQIPATASVDAASSADFSLFGGCPTTLEPGDSCTVNVRFNPTTSGAKTGTLTMGTFTAGLSGTGTSPLNISPPSANFGTISIGSTSAPTQFTVTNSGGTSMSTPVSITGTDAPQFPFSNGCPSSLGAGLSCSVTVSFSPTTTGAKTATLTVGGQTASLTGSGTGGLTISPASSAYGSIPIGTSTVTTVFTVSNISAQSLSTPVALSGTDATQFAISTNTCPASLAASNSCSVLVRFRPTTTGAKSGTITVGTASAPLSGTGAAASTILLTPIFQELGPVAVGQNSQEVAIYVTNKGTSAFTPQLSMTGPDLNEFSVGFNGCASLLDVNATCEIMVRTIPGSAGFKRAALMINNTVASAFGATASSGGGGAVVAMVPTYTDFGSVATGSTTTSAFVQVINGTSSSFTLTVPQFGGTNAADFAWTNHNCLSTLAPGGACWVAVTFTAKGAGVRTGTVTVGSGVSANLYGTGIGAGTVTITPSTFNYGNIPLGTSFSGLFTITNNTAAAVSTTPSVTGTDPTQFPIQGNPCPGTLNPTASCTMTVGFAPTTLGAKSATFTVAGATSALTGTGVATNVTVSPSSKDYGSVAVGTPVSQTFVATNNNPNASYQPNVSVTGTNPGDFVVTSNGCTSIVNTGNTCSVSLRFTPAATGARLATLNIGPGVTVAVSGTGTSSSPITNLVVFDTATTNPPAGTDGIANSTQWSIQSSNFATGLNSHGDRTNTIKTIGDSTLVGKTWIRTAADSKNYTGTPLATFVINVTQLNILIDDRYGPSPTRPTWLDSSFTNTGLKVTILEGSTDRPYTIWRKTVTAGSTITLPTIGATTAPCYIVVVQ